MKTKRPISLFLSIILALGLLTGCQSATTSFSPQGDGTPVSVFTNDTATEDSLTKTDAYGNPIHEVTHRDCTMRTMDAATSGGAFIE